MKVIEKYTDKATGADATLFEDGTLIVWGTGEKQDILQDLKIGIFSHRGSRQQAEFLLKEVDWTLVRKVFGHSLGGGVALHMYKKNPVTTETFGSIRPFFILCRIPKNADVINYIFGCDPVPRIFLLMLRKFIGKVERIKGKGFHPISDHNRYQKLKPYCGWIKDEL